MRRAPLHSLTARTAALEVSRCWASGAAGDDTTAHGGDIGKTSHPLAETLEGIIRKDRIVVFLTGTPTAPRCRFTVATVDLLRQLGVQYSFFNILDDDEICEGLKEYSSWPTYPQVYIDGELIGGYDVCKKMLLDGDLTKLLKEKGLL